MLLWKYVFKFFYGNFFTNLKILNVVKYLFSDFMKSKNVSLIFISGMLSIRVVCVCARAPCFEYIFFDKNMESFSMPFVYYFLDEKCTITYWLYHILDEKLRVWLHSKSQYYKILSIINVFTLILLNRNVKKKVHYVRLNIIWIIYSKVDFKGNLIIKCTSMVQAYSKILHNTFTQILSIFFFLRIFFFSNYKNLQNNNFIHLVFLWKC